LLLQKCVIISIIVCLEFYFGAGDSYYTFSSNETYTRGEAALECEKKNGSLASIKNENIQNLVMDALNYEIIDKYWSTTGSSF